MGDCYKCRRPLQGGTYFIQDGRQFHKECKESWICARCHRDVEDEVTTALGKHWHKHCFNCSNCHAQLDGKFVPRDNDPICHNCATKSLPKCVMCSRELIGEFTNYEGKSYHNDCFKCGSCNMKLPVSGFVSKGGKALCERCGTR